MASPKDNIKPVVHESIKWNVGLMERPDGSKYVHAEITAAQGLVIVMDMPPEACIELGNHIANLGKLGKLGLTIVEGS